MSDTSKPELLNPFEVAARLDKLRDAIVSWYPEWRDAREQLEAGLRPLIGLYRGGDKWPDSNEQASRWLTAGAGIRAVGLTGYPAEVLANRGVHEQARLSTSDFTVYGVWALFTSASADDGEKVAEWVAQATRLFDTEPEEFAVEVQNGCDALLRRWFQLNAPRFTERLRVAAAELRLSHPQVLGMRRISMDRTEQSAYRSWFTPFETGLNMVGNEVRLEPRGDGDAGSDSLQESPPPVTKAAPPEAVPPAAPPPPNLLGVRPESTGGFPHYESYLPESYDLSPAVVWPLAQRQFAAFVRCLDVADGKLSQLHSRVPDVFRQWWVRQWAHRFRCRTLRITTVADIRARYEFFRRVDNLLYLSTTPPETPLSHDAEFTYYDRPLMVSDGRGGAHPEPFATFARQGEWRRHLTPIPFPRSPTPQPRLAPRLTCEDFMAWGGFLASPEPLTPDQREELGHVGIDPEGAGGEPGWCRSTMEWEIGRFVPVVTDSFRETIRRIAEANTVTIPRIPGGVPLADVLDAVFNWLALPEVVALNGRVSPARPTNPPTEPNAVEGEHRHVPQPDGAVYPQPSGLELPAGFRIGVHQQRLSLIWNSPAGRRTWSCDGRMASGAMPDPIRSALGVSSWPASLFPVSRSAPAIRQWAMYCHSAARSFLRAEHMPADGGMGWLSILRATRELCAAVGVPGCSEDRLAVPLPVDRAAGLMELTALADALVRHADRTRPAETVTVVPPPPPAPTTTAIAVEFIPEATEPDGSDLDNREITILVEMCAMGATFERDRETQEAIVARCQKGANADTWKRTFSRLRQRGYIDSKTGPNGGCWLTRVGNRVAERLRDQS